MKKVSLLKTSFLALVLMPAVAAAADRVGDFSGGDIFFLPLHPAAAVAPPLCVRGVTGGALLGGGVLS